MPTRVGNISAEAEPSAENTPQRTTYMQSLGARIDRSLYNMVNRPRSPATIERRRERAQRRQTEALARLAANPSAYAYEQEQEEEWEGEGNPMDYRNMVATGEYPTEARKERKLPPYEEPSPPKYTKKKPSFLKRLIKGKPAPPRYTKKLKTPPVPSYTAGGKKSRKIKTRRTHRKKTYRKRK